MSHVQAYRMTFPADCSTNYFCIKHSDWLVIRGMAGGWKGTNNGVCTSITFLCPPHCATRTLHSSCSPEKHNT